MKEIDDEEEPIGAHRGDMEGEVFCSSSYENSTTLSLLCALLPFYLHHQSCISVFTHTHTQVFLFTIELINRNGIGTALT